MSAQAQAIQPATKDAVQPLQLKVNTYGSAEEIHGHIRYALSLGLPSLTPALCSHDGTFLIAGSGPSLPDFADEMRAEVENGRPICAVNGAHEFLLGKGIEPTFFLSLDPRPGICAHLTEIGEDTIYLMASRCHPRVFDALLEKGAKVILWHAMPDSMEATAFPKGTMLVGGCSTSGLRALNVAYYMGFRRFVMYGVDSCLGKDGITKRYNGDKAGQVTEFRVGQMKDGKQNISNPRVFKANLAMANQAAEFNKVYSMMPGITVEARGDGLLAAVIEQRRSMGLPT